MSADHEGRVERFGERPAERVLVDLGCITQGVLLAAATHVCVAFTRAEFPAINAPKIIDDLHGLVHQQRRLVDHRDAVQMPHGIETGREQAREPLRESGRSLGGRFQYQVADQARLIDAADDQRWGEPPGVGEGRLGFLVFSLAVDDDAVALAPECARGLPDLLHQHAGGIVLRDADALSKQPLLVVIGGAERRDDHDVFVRERVPQQRDGDSRLRQPAVDRERKALVRLQESEAAPPQVLVHERIVDEFAQHEDPAARILGQGLVGALDGVLHPEAEAEMTRNDVAHRAEIERGRTVGGTFACAIQRLDCLAKRALIQGAGGLILRVDVMVAFPLDAKAVDVVVLAKAEIGYRNEVGLNSGDRCGE